MTVLPKPQLMTLLYLNIACISFYALGYGVVCTCACLRIFLPSAIEVICLQFSPKFVNASSKLTRNSRTAISYSSLSFPRDGGCCAVTAVGGEAAGSWGVPCLQPGAGTVPTVTRNHYLLFLLARARVDSVCMVTGSSFWQQAASLEDDVQSHLRLPAWAAVLFVITQ